MLHSVYTLGGRACGHLTVHAGETNHLGKKDLCHLRSCLIFLIKDNNNTDCAEASLDILRMSILIPVFPLMGLSVEMQDWLKRTIFPALFVLYPQAFLIVSVLFMDYMSA